MMNLSTWKLVMLVGCCILYMEVLVKEPQLAKVKKFDSKSPGLDEPDTAEERRGKQNPPTRIHAGPEYGLDFQLEYSLAGENKERLEKGTNTSPNQTLGQDCDRIIPLKKIDQTTSLPPGLFLVESSGRSILSARQACAVESAALRSGLDVTLIITATELDLRDNTTCYLYMKTDTIKFYSMDARAFALKSPLEDFFNSSILAQSYYRTEHTADAIRLLLIYKFGGFYLDLDYVVLRDLTHYNNMLLEEGDAPGGGAIYVTNSAFMFNAQHPFLLTAMQDLQKGYNNPACWACIGPGLLTGVARNVTNVSMIQDIPDSADLTVTLIQRMMPVHWTAAQGVLFPEEPVSFRRWKTIFENSSTVHFFGHMTAHLAVHDDPQYSAYALLGPRYCPLAYYSTKLF